LSECGDLLEQSKRGRIAPPKGAKTSPKGGEALKSSEERKKVLGSGNATYKIRDGKSRVKQKAHTEHWDEGKGAQKKEKIFLLQRGPLRKKRPQMRSSVGGSL